MTRRRTPRPAAQAQALIALAALPLVLTTSNVAVTQASAARTGDSVPAPTAASLDAIAADDLPDLGDSDTSAAVPAAFQVPERPALGTPRAGDIPWAALQAYQRAADILGEVQPSCGLSWTLLGAVGQVESEHGTVRGGELGSDGVVSPELVSRALDGKGRRPAVEDTDSGKVDGDGAWDRSVGPMQLLPGVWSLVGVDGDGDGTRSPQDVDDAALAAAVYLCSVGADLSDPDGAAEALAEYNGAAGYADQVLAVAKRYANREFDVSGAPKPSSIGSTLDDGQGSPARESERALREAQEEREQEQPTLSARRTQHAADRDASRSRPEPSAADGDAKHEDDASAPEPGPSAPRDGSGEDDGQRPDGDPTEQPTEQPTDEPVDPAAPVDELEPGHWPDVEPAEEPTGEGEESGDEPEEPADAADESGDQAGQPGGEDGQPADQGDEPGDQGDEPGDQGDEPGDQAQQPGAETEAPANEADEADEEQTGGDRPAEDTGDQPADQTDADGTTDEADQTDDGDQTEEPATEPTDEADEEQTGGDRPAEDTGDQPAGDADTDAGEQGTSDEQDAEQPTPVAVTGELTVCGEGFCLDGAALDLTAAGDLTAQADTDLDGDGTVEPVADELAGLQGRTVELLVVEGTEPLLVVAVDGHVVVPD